MGPRHIAGLHTRTRHRLQQLMRTAACPQRRPVNDAGQLSAQRRVALSQRPARLGIGHRSTRSPKSPPPEMIGRHDNPSPPSDVSRVDQAGAVGASDPHPPHGNAPIPPPVSALTAPQHRLADVLAILRQLQRLQDRVIQPIGYSRPSGIGRPRGRSPPASHQNTHAVEVGALSPFPRFCSGGV